MSVRWCVSALLLVVVAGCEKPPVPNRETSYEVEDAPATDAEFDRPPDPDPEIYYQFDVTDAKRAGLTPKGREFFDLMKEGKVLGAYESDFKDHFKDVVLKEEISNGRKRYYFSFVGRKQDYEGEPVIAVTIHKRTGRIIECAVYTPDW